MRINEGLVIFPYSNQKLLAVNDKVRRWPLGWTSTWNVTLFPSVLWRCWLDDRKDIRPVKNWMLVCWWWWFDWSFARLIAPVVQLSPPPPSSTPANPGSPPQKKKWPLKRREIQNICFACFITPVVTTQSPPPSSLVPIKSRTKTLWYRLTCKGYPGKWPLNEYRCMISDHIQP